MEQEIEQRLARLETILDVRFTKEMIEAAESRGLHDRLHEEGVRQLTMSVRDSFLLGAVQAAGVWLIAIALAAM